jgi:hypothetical protein
VTRHIRLLGKVRKTPQREARKWRCRQGRRLRAELRAVLLVHVPRDRPWSDPAYTGVLRDIREALAREGRPR